MFSSLPSLKPMIDSGKIRAIGMTAPTSSSDAKGIPTIARAGVPDFEYTTWYAPMSRPERRSRSLTD
jgi:tripartite-type tricarboxylate transporter receptor subunit TctC